MMIIKLGIFPGDFKPYLLMIITLDCGMLQKATLDKTERVNYIVW